MKTLNIAAFLLISAASLFALEVAELRNGFTIEHYAREMRDGQVRLYLDAGKQSFVDVSEAEVQSYRSEPDPVVPATPQQAKSTQEIVNDASAKHGVDAAFVGSVIKHESAGKTHAVSRRGAQGLMQLMPETATKLGVHDSFSPEQNVHGGTLYLKELLERYNGDAVKALAAYNAGPGAVDRYKGVPPYRETREYVLRVIRDYNQRKLNEKKDTTSAAVPKNGAP